MPPRKKKSSGGRAFTVEFPQPLPAEKRGDAWWMEADGRELRLSNLDKVFWPEEGYTKGDLLAFYYNVAQLILPHLHDRPLTMKRMPDGMAGPFFYEKTAPSHTPDWVARCPVQSEDSKDGVIGYMTGSNAYFERVAKINAAWNRAIFYDGSLFHGPDVDQPSLLSDDVLRGRLTLNGFFGCKRQAA